MLRLLCATALSLVLSFSTHAGAGQKSAPLSSQAERGIIIINEKTTLKPGMVQGLVTSVGPDAVEVQGKNGKTYRFRNVPGGVKVGDKVGVEVDPTGD
jgi:hypothetical protein